MINDACENIPIDCYKYVDDLTLLECRKVTDPSDLPAVFYSLGQWSCQNHMKLNPSKCFSLSVTFSKNPPAEPTLYIDDSPLQNFQSVKILGVIVQSNLKWDLHVTEILKKYNRKLYMFRLLKRYGLSVADLKLVYTGYIRPVMEYFTPVFNGGLTQKQIRSLEQVKKKSMKNHAGYTLHKLYQCLPNM